MAVVLVGLAAVAVQFVWEVEPAAGNAVSVGVLSISDYGVIYLEDHSAFVAALETMGCDQGQGFYYARPVESAEVPALLARCTGSADPRKRSAGGVVVHRQQEVANIVSHPSFAQTRQ